MTSPWSQYENNRNSSWSKKKKSCSPLDSFPFVFWVRQRRDVMTIRNVTDFSYRAGHNRAPLGWLRKDSVNLSSTPCRLGEAASASDELYFQSNQSETLWTLAIAQGGGFGATNQEEQATNRQTQVWRECIRSNWLITTTIFAVHSWTDETNSSPTSGPLHALCPSPRRCSSLDFPFSPESLSVSV